MNSTTHRAGVGALGPWTPSPAERDALCPGDAGSNLGRGVLGGLLFFSVSEGAIYRSAKQLLKHHEIMTRSTPGTQKGRSTGSHSRILGRSQQQDTLTQQQRDYLVLVSSAIWNSYTVLRVSGIIPRRPSAASALLRNFRVRLLVVINPGHCHLGPGPEKKT